MEIKCSRVYFIFPMTRYIDLARTVECDASNFPSLGHTERAETRAVGFGRISHPSRLAIGILTMEPGIFLSAVAPHHFLILRSALNSRQMSSRGHNSKRDDAPTTDFAFLRKRRHVRSDTSGFWIIPRTPPARNKFSSRSRPREERGRNPGHGVFERRKLGKVALICSKYARSFAQDILQRSSPLFLPLSLILFRVHISHGTSLHPCKVDNTLNKSLKSPSSVFVRFQLMLQRDVRARVSTTVHP